MHSGQKATDDLADSIKNLMKALSNIIGSTSYILYGLLGLGALVVGYKAYKSISENGKTAKIKSKYIKEKEKLKHKYFKGDRK